MTEEVIEIPKILNAGIKFLKFLDQPYGIIPIAIKDGTKRPMCKVKNQLDNLFRIGDEAYIKQWSSAQFFGLVTNPSFNPDIEKQLFVVDVDIPTEGGHEKDGREHLHKLDITDTFTVQTPSGGIHYLYWAPLGHKFKHAPYDGIDLVWKSPFYFVGIGSPKYKLINKVPIADASEELLEQLKYVHNVKLNKDGTRETILDTIMKDGISSGARHDTILRLMASLAKKRVQKSEAMAIAELAISKCDQSSGVPTLEEAEAQYIDALGKFTSGISIDELIDDKVLLTSSNTIKTISKPSESAVSESAFLNMYPNNEPNTNRPLNQQGNFPMAKLGRVWLDTPEKKMASRIGYRPCDEVLYDHGESIYFNKYKAPFFEDIEIDDLVIQKFQTVFKRTFGPIYEDWLKVLKYKYLNPHVKFSWCIYLTSKSEGTGKGLSWKLTEAIFGKDNCMSIPPSEFNQRFNAKLSECTFALVDEAHGVVTKSARNAMMNALKRIITEDTMTTEVKNLEKDLGIESYFFMYIFSNDRTSLEINKGSRRFLVYHDEEPNTPKQKELMTQVGDMIRDPQMVSMFVKWVMENVDISQSNKFSPKGEARKTEDLLNSGSDIYLSPEVFKIKEAIESYDDIFYANIVTQSQLEFYCIQEFGNRSHKVIKDLIESTLVSKIPQLTKANKVQYKRVNYFKPDTSLAREGLSIQDTYGDKKLQSPIIIIRNLEDYKKMGHDEFTIEIHKQIEKNGPKRPGSHLNTVD